MRLLLINPNRSQWITERVAAPARAVLLAHEELHAVTSVDGPEVVRTPPQIDAARDEVLALAARHGAGYEARILGISLDCGWAEARAQQWPQPVIGMTEAACMAACLHGRRFGVLTVGAAMRPHYERHVHDLGLAARCAGVVAPDCAHAFASEGGALQAEVLAVLLGGLSELRRMGADSVVLAGAVLCGYGPGLQRLSRMPVFEGPVCAVGMARTLCAHGRWMRA